MGIKLVACMDSWPSTEETYCLHGHYIRFWNHGAGIGSYGESPKSGWVEWEEYLQF